MGLIHPPVGLNIFVINRIAPDIGLGADHLGHAAVRRADGAGRRDPVGMPGDRDVAAEFGLRGLMARCWLRVIPCQDRPPPARHATAADHGRPVPATARCRPIETGPVTSMTLRGIAPSFGAQQIPGLLIGADDAGGAQQHDRGIGQEVQCRWAFRRGRKHQRAGLGDAAKPCCRLTMSVGSARPSRMSARAVSPKGSRAIPDAVP